VSPKFRVNRVDYDPNEVREWIWRNRVPHKKVTLVSGDWSSGKTRVVASVIEHVFSHEDYPDGEVPELEPGHILFVTTESDTNEIGQILHAQGMNLEQIKEYIRVLDYLQSDDKQNLFVFDLDKDLPALEAEIKRYKPIIVVFDPLVEFHNRKEIDSHQIRGLMMKLNNYAERWGCAIIGLIHWNKDEKKSRANRISGSAQYGAGVKSVITIYRDQKIPNKRYCEQTKNSLGPDQPTISFSIEPPDGLVVWGETLGPPGLETKLPTKVGDAEQFLLKFCADEPKLVKECIAVSGFNERTLRRARSRLGHQILTVEIFTDGRTQSHWDLACERNLWGAHVISTEAPKL
jgi:putative DNA primase/helicase